MAQTWYLIGNELLACGAAAFAPLLPITLR